MDCGANSLRAMIHLRLFPVLLLCLGGCARPQVSTEPVDGHGYLPAISAITRLRTTQTGDGQALRFPDPVEMTALEVVIPAGAETGWHRHPAPGFAYVFSGELVVETTSGPPRHYRPGEAFAEVVGVAHNGRAVGREPVRLIAWFSAVPGTPVPVKEPLVR